MGQEATCPTCPSLKVVQPFSPLVIYRRDISINSWNKNSDGWVLREEKYHKPPFFEHLASSWNFYLRQPFTVLSVKSKVYYYSHFTREEIKAQRQNEGGSRPQSTSGGGMI